jgi:hypothetical protein
MKKNNSHVRRYFDLAAGLMLMLLTFGFPAQAAEPRVPTFDHMTTGFPLRGAHAQLECQTCHVNGQFKGTPTECARCHMQGSRTASIYKPTNHIQTTQPCDQCHTSNSTWAGARFRHTGIMPGSCMQCHTGVMAIGKPTGHVVTTQPCDVCHRTTAWVPAAFNHAGVIPGTCSSCHGVTATGKPTGHVSTTLECDACHSTAAWLPAGFNHTGVVAGTCLNCHGAGKASGLPSGHIPAAGISCDACHNTTTFTTSTMRNHTVSQGVLPGGCLLCHNGAYTSQGARGKPNDHTSAAQSQSCDAAGCHTTKTWSK